MQLVLSLFPGVGLLDRAFEETGFCVVRGPDLLWGGDVRRFRIPPGRIDGIIGGPPCQAHSPLARIVRHGGNRPAPDMIPEFSRCVREARPAWWIMENVPQAPDPEIQGYASVTSFVLQDHWFGGLSRRRRRFVFGGAQAILEPVCDALHETRPRQPACASGGIAEGHEGSSQLRHRGVVSNRVFRDHCMLQGLPDDFDLPGMTIVGKVRAVGNGVPLAMGRAVARAIWESVAEHASKDFQAAKDGADAESHERQEGTKNGEFGAETVIREESDEH